MHQTTKQKTNNIYCGKISTNVEKFSVLFVLGPVAWLVDGWGEWVRKYFRCRYFNNHFRLHVYILPSFMLSWFWLVGLVFININIIIIIIANASNECFIVLISISLFDNNWLISAMLEWDREREIKRVLIKLKTIRFIEVDTHRI